MVADLVDQHMADDMLQVLAGLAPIFEDRPAVEEGHVHLLGDVADALAREIDAPIEARQIERRFQMRLAAGPVIGKSAIWMFRLRQSIDLPGSGDVSQRGLTSVVKPEF